VSRSHFLPGVLGAVLLVAGCDNMQHQENVRADEPSKFFADGTSARLPPAHTVAQADLAPDDPLGQASLEGAWVQAFPVPVTRQLIERGGERYGIYCAECHGADGYGQGIVVRRGFPAPPSFHEARDRAEPAGQVFEAISHGYGIMYGFADRISPRDRWAIVAYIRALQKTQHATLAEVPAAERGRLGTP
jgi:mono/diheme cytochrome c family protein